MTEEQVRAIFLLAGLQVTRLEKLADGYIETRSHPWWLVFTPLGDIKIGWRKRVINIEWPESRFVKGTELTTDEVTKWETGIHAWGFSKAVEYLQSLKYRAAKCLPPSHDNPPHGYLPCTRAAWHAGPCAHELKENAG